MRNCRTAIRKLLWIAAGSVFLFSAFMLFQYQINRAASNAVTEAVIRSAVKENPPLPASTGSEETAPESEDVDLPHETAPICVDFEELSRQNADIVAWIYCPDTPINYPVVQASDNRYYLHRLIDGTGNASGTLFLDYRNTADFSDINSVIYGHNMQNASMFGSLPKYKNQEYYTQHPVLYLLTPEQDYKVELLAGYVTSSDSEIYDIPLLNREGTSAIAEQLLNASFAEGTTLEEDTRLLTLSTCSYEYEQARYVLIGAMKTLSKR